MKAYWTPIIFAAGLGAGLLIASGGARENAETAGNKSTAPVVRIREPRPVTTPHETKFRSFARELPELSREAKEAFQKSLAPGDRAAAIDAMLAQAGPDGISWDAKSMIEEILLTWAGEDFDGAWAWGRRIENDANHMFVAAILLNALAAKDLDRAFALHLEMAAEDANFKSNVPILVLEQAAITDAASFLDILGKLPFGNDTSGEAMNFAADFNFQQAADGVDALKKNHGLNKPSVFPINFLLSWASRDADAAYAWFAKREIDPFAEFDPGEAFGRLLEGIEEHSPGASYAWAADKLNVPGADRDEIIQSLAQDYRDSLPIIINSIVQAMPDTASRDRFLGEMAERGYFNCSNDTLNFVLTQISSPSARLETLQRLKLYGLLNTAKIPDAHLQQWGLTRQQVEQAEVSGH